MGAIESLYEPAALPEAVAALIREWVCPVDFVQNNPKREPDEDGRGEELKWGRAAIPALVGFGGGLVANVVDWVGVFGRWLSWWAPRMMRGVALGS